MNLLIKSGLLLAGLLAGCGKRGAPAASEADASDTIPVKTAKFANLPYADHTYSSIGVAKGWFKEVGIDLQADTITVDDAVPSLESGAYDVVSVPPGVLFSAYETAPDLCSFVFGDMFLGSAIMAQPGRGYRTYTDLRNGGMSHKDAIQSVIGQLKGQTFAYPAENAIRPFIDFALQQGGLTRRDVKSLVLTDPLAVNAMRNKQADFQVGDVPSRIALQKEGFVPILSSVDLAKAARGSPDSRELASILQNGWAMKKERYRSDQPFALRMASVNFRIMKYMATNRDDAVGIHMASLSKATGQKFTAEDGRIIYDYVDPFVTFEDQRPWFHAPGNPLYYSNINGATLMSLIAGKVYKKTPPRVDDVIFADDTYWELDRLKTASEYLFASLKGKENSGGRIGRRIAAARRYYDAYDFYDAERLASAALREAAGTSKP